MNFFRIRLGLVPTRGRRFLLSPVVDRISFFSTFESENLISSSAPLNSGISSPAPFKSGISSSSSRSLSPASQRRFLLKQLRNEKIGAVGDLLKDIRDQSSDEKRTMGDLRRWARMFEKEGRRELSVEIFNFMATVHGPSPRTNRTKTKKVSLVNPRQCLGIYSIADAAAMVSPSVVHLELPRGSYGSGFIVDQFGTIMTCAHVVINEENYIGKPEEELYLEDVHVVLADNRTFEGVITWHNRDLDVALVKPKTRKTGFFPYVKLGLSSKVFLGEHVFSLGSPLGLRNSVTAGVISFIDRTNVELSAEFKVDEELKVDEEFKVDEDIKPNLFLQSTCFVNDGSSGGPLINLNAEVIGINVYAIYVEQSGKIIGAASIPIKKAFDAVFA